MRTDVACSRVGSTHFWLVLTVQVVFRFCFLLNSFPCNFCFSSSCFVNIKLLCSRLLVCYCVTKKVHRSNWRAETRKRFIKLKLRHSHFVTLNMLLLWVYSFRCCILFLASALVLNCYPQWNHHNKWLKKKEEAY